MFLLLALVRVLWAAWALVTQRRTRVGSAWMRLRLATAVLRARFILPSIDTWHPPGRRM